MKVLVTGGTGFIGSHLVNRLIKMGHSVALPCREESNLEFIASSGVEPERADLLNYRDCCRLVDGIDVIFHLASIRGSGWSYTDKQIRDTNINITENLLRASCGEVKQFIYISSVSVHGHFTGGPADENYPFNPATRYGMTKYESENTVKKYHKEKDLNTTIIRPVITYGPGDTWGMVTKLVRLIKSKRYLTVGSGDNRVHLIYIDDLIDGLALTINNTRAFGEAFILAGERPVTVNKLVEMVETGLNRSIPEIHVPLLIAMTAARLMEISHTAFRNEKEPFITKDKIDIMCRDRCFSIKKAEERIGFSPKVSYEEGVKRTIDWLKNYESI